MRGLTDRYQVNLQLERVNQMNLENVNNQYKKDLLQFFTIEQLEGLYENCPIWAGIEKECYGNTILDTLKKST